MTSTRLALKVMAGAGLVLALGATLVQAQQAQWEAQVVRAQAAVQKGDYAKAEEELAAAVKTAEGQAAPGDRLIRTLMFQESVFVMQKKFAEAVAPAKRILRFRIRSW